MPFLDKVKHKAEELQLDKKAKDLQAAATAAAKQAREKAGLYTAENREKIDGYVDKAASTIDAKTAGKYSDKVAKAKQTVAKGVDKVAVSSASPGGTGDPVAPREATPSGGADGPRSAAAESDSQSSSTFPVDPEAPPVPERGTPGHTPPLAPEG